MDKDHDFNEYFPLNPSMVEELERLFKKSTSWVGHNNQLDTTNALNLGNLQTGWNYSNYHVTGQNNDESFRKVMAEFRENGIDKEYCPDFLLTDKNSFKTKNVAKKQSPIECVFCRNNGEEQEFYRRHVLKDKDGKVICPVLRAYTCPMCGAHGDVAHTIKYCPRSTRYEINSTVLALKTARTAAGKRRSSLKN